MTAYEMRISDWSSDVCSSDLRIAVAVNARLDIVLDLRLQIGTEDIEGEFGNRLPRDAAVDAIFVDAAQVAIQVAIGHRIIGRGQAIVVLGEPARHLRLQDRKSTRLNSSHSCASRMPAYV